MLSYLISFRRVHDLRTTVVSIAALLSGSVVFSSPAYPWSSKGHEIVATIAQAHLTDTDRKRIKNFVSRRINVARQGWRPDS